MTGVQTKKRAREVAGTSGARVKAKLGVEDAITSSSLSYYPGFIGINSHLSSEALLRPVPASALYPNSIGASAGVPIETLDEGYGTLIFQALTYPSFCVAEFRGEIGDIQTSIMDLSSNLEVGDYSTILQGRHEGYMFGYPYNGAEEYHR